MANTDWTENTRVADHAIELAAEGHQQAQAAGKFLSEYFAEHHTELLESDPNARSIPKIRLWHSPYKRTRQTAAGIVETCRLPRLGSDASTEFHIPRVLRMGYPDETDTYAPNVLKGQVDVRKTGDSWLLDQREHLLLHEQQFGLFDGLSDEERKKHYPREQAYYEKCKKFGGKMWPKMPQGESRMDVCQRVHEAFGTFHRDERKHGIGDIVVVGHGTTNRAFVQMWMHKPWEWMHREPNPRNCSVRLLQDGVDKGYIFDGFDNPEGYKHKVKEVGE